jgi:NADH:ubiquinone oxidoreductase subunit K
MKNDRFISLPYRLSTNLFYRINGCTAFFIIAIAASEVAVGLGLLIVLYKKYGSLDLDDLAKMKG